MSNNSNNPFEVIQYQLSELQRGVDETKELLRSSLGGPQTHKFVKGDQALADELGVGLSTIRKWRKAGIISSTQNGRVILYDLPTVREDLKSHRRGRKN